MPRTKHPGIIREFGRVDPTRIGTKSPSGYVRKTGRIYNHSADLPVGNLKNKKYNEELFPEQCYIACSQMGATQEDLAQLFGVSYNTIKGWMKRYPEFRDAFRKGKDEYDTDAVERKALLRATGYDFKKTKTVKKRILVDKERMIYKWMTVEKHSELHHIPPDPKSFIFWLRNRNPERWPDVLLNRSTVVGDKEQPIEHNHNHNHQLDLSDLPTEQLEIIIASMLNQQKQITYDQEAEIIE